VGDIGEARIRLNRLIYEQKPLRRITRSEVRKGALAAYLKRRISRSDVRKGALAYAKGNEHKPDYDWTLLIRFFERVWNAQRQRSLDDLAVVSLIGGHAYWWDSALEEDEQDEARRALSEFARWASRYKKEHPDEPRLADWGSVLGERKRDKLLASGRSLSWFRRDITE
jgi:hypothetical protein